MIVLLFLFGALLAVGVFLLLANALKLPYLKTSKAVINAGKSDKKVTRTFEAMIVNIAAWGSKFIRLDSYKREIMSRTLKVAGIKLTPEAYVAQAITKALLTGLLAIPCAFILPFVVPIIVILAVAVYFKEIGKAENKMKEKREAIERQLPRFVATIEQELKSSRDVLSIMENYKKHASGHFADELDITCADMRSSGYEAAITRFEARIGSSQLSDVARGLISVIRGDDSAVYFKMLAHDFKLIELQALKAQAAKIPSKIRIYSFVMLALFMLTYIVVMGMQLIQALGMMM